ncbi:MAG: phosphoribosyltransferase family protein [Candidatus Falkowbacteria bacterium]|nr:phosphoribosyltransferase family protein [Candidatus Falkowbacteria bacterium]
MDTISLSFKQKVISFFVALKIFLIDFLFPIECLSCGLEKVWLCTKCTRSIKLNSEQICLVCKKTNFFGQICPECKSGSYLDGVMAATFYGDKIVEKLIKILKYNFVTDLSANIGELMNYSLRDLLNKSRLLGDDSPLILREIENALLIPVPLHKRRERWRGFNQSKIIAESIINYFNLTMDCDHLKRIKYKKAQARKDSADRLENVLDCFVWQGESLAGKSVIIIDDVVTTGATLGECARVLKQNGAQTVWGLCLARGC